MSRNMSCVRKLFPSTSDDQGKNDNFTNKQKEELDNELREKSKLWHYDFKNDRAMPGKGNVTWRTSESGVMIGRLEDRSQEESDAEDSQSDFTTKCSETNEVRNENRPNDSVDVDDRGNIAIEKEENAFKEYSSEVCSEHDACDDKASGYIGDQSTPVKAKPST